MSFWMRRLVTQGECAHLRLITQGEYAHLRLVTQGECAHLRLVTQGECAHLRLSDLREFVMRWSNHKVLQFIRFSDSFFISVLPFAITVMSLCKFILIPDCRKQYNHCNNGLC